MFETLISQSLLPTKSLVLSLFLLSLILNSHVGSSELTHSFSKTDKEIYLSLTLIYEWVKVPWFRSVTFKVAPASLSALPELWREAEVLDDVTGIECVALRKEKAARVIAAWLRVTTTFFILRRRPSYSIDYSSGTSSVLKLLRAKN